MSTKRPLPTGAGYGRGFACGNYDSRCFIAVSTDVHIDDATQQIKLQHMCRAQGVGMAVNQDQLRVQVESNMAWSIGMALFEKLEVADDDIQSSNYDNSIIPRMADMPRLDIEIIDPVKITCHDCR